MTRNVIYNRLLVLLLEIAILLGSVSVITVVADGSDFVSSSVTAQEVSDMHSGNILRKSQISLTKSGGLLFSSGTREYLRKNSQLVDGKCEKEAFKHTEEGDGLLFANYSNTNSAAFTFTFALDDTYSIEKLLISTGSTAPAKAYNIYISDSSEKLFNTVPVIQYTGGDSQSINRVHVLKNALKGSYIGIEFTHMTKTTWGYAVQLLELGAYGNRVPDGYTCDDTVTDSYVSENDSSAIHEIEKYTLSAAQSLSDPQILSDGKTDTAFTLSAQDGAKPRVTLQLCGTYMIESVLISLSQRSLSVNYSVYLGDSEEGLYTDDNIVILHNYTYGEGAPVLFTFNKEQAAKYIGVQFNTTVCEDGLNFAELLELSVYGKKVPEDYTVRTNISDSTLSSDYVTENHSNNLLSEGIIGMTKDTSSAGYYLAYGSGGTYTRSLNMLADGKTSLDGYTHKEDGDTLRFDQTSNGASTANFKLQLDLGFFDCTVESVLIYGLKGNEIGGYNIYISDQSSDLFEYQNWVAFYNNNDCSEAQQIIFNEKLSGKYVGFEVTVKNLNESQITLASNKQNIFIKEIAVYGERDLSQKPQPAYEYTVYEDIVDQDYVTENHKYNLIRYARSTNTLDDGTDHTSKSFSSYTTDGTVYDGSTHYTWYNTEEVFTPFCATYSLGQTVAIDRVMFASFYHSSINFSTIAYEIYISDTIDDLYSKENLAVYQNNYGKWRANEAEAHTGASQVFEFTGEKPIGRYIGFRIISPNAGQDNTVRIEQLGVYSDGVFPVDPIYIQSFTDDSTGVKVSVRKLSYEDEFKNVASLIVERFALSEDVISQASSYYLTSLGDGYRIILKDTDGKILTEDDLGGRKIEISIPYKYSGTGILPYACQIDGSMIIKNDALFNGDTAVFITSTLNPIAFFEDTFSHGFADSLEFDWDPVYELSLKALESANDETDLYENDTAEADVQYSDEDNSAGTNSAKKVKKIITTRKVIRKNNSLFNSLWFWLIIAGVCLAATVTAVFIIIKRKKRKI